MNSYYTSIDLGTDSIKILVCNKLNGKFYVIASLDYPSLGIKKGIVTDVKKASLSLKKALKSFYDKVGLKIRKAIVSIPPNNCSMDIVSGTVPIKENQKVDGEDVTRVLKRALKDKVFDDEELVTMIPIQFKVDSEEGISDPKGLKTKKLGVKALITCSQKAIVYDILEVFKLAGVEVVDICYTTTGDYYEVKNNKIDKTHSAIINIGEESTSVSVYNKGIMIKNKIINVGSHNVDNDISYIFKTSLEDSRILKEHFVVASSRYADVNENYEVKLPNEENIVINQLNISQVVEARVQEILKIVKNDLKALTKREISYIIVTGGLSELAGFQYIVEEILGVKARICNITTMGVRHNKYCSALGTIKYFDSKLDLRGQSINMLSSNDIDKLISVSNEVENEKIVGKVFGRFFEN